MPCLPESDEYDKIFAAMKQAVRFLILLFLEERTFLKLLEEWRQPIAFRIKVLNKES